MSGFRLPRDGADIDRTRPLTFHFDGKSHQGFAGDTLASALLANGVSIVARSFKYHRPRGVFGTGFAEPNALVQLGEGAHATPNIPATLIPLTDGLKARGQNGWPSVDHDLAAINSRLAPVFAAGFYYKTFMWPGWRLFEPFIRRAAGIGKAPTLPDPDAYDMRERASDVLVIGGGPAGLIAALTAARAGADVVLVEADTRLGASLAAEPRNIDDAPAAAWGETIARELADLENVTLLTRTTALGYYDHNFVTAVEEIDRPSLRQRLWKLRARRIVLATGAFERPLLFANNDRPGVMLAGSVHDYIARYAVAPGHAPLFATTNDSTYAVAFAAQEAGLDVRCIVDARADCALAGEARKRGIAVRLNSTVTAAKGNKRVKAAEIATPGGPQTIACDVIAASGGWTPAVQLFTQSGGALRFDEAIGAFVPECSAQAEQSCGAAAGIFDLAACLKSGAEAGRFAAEQCGLAAAMDIPSVSDVSVTPPHAAIEPRGTAKTVFVDLQTDVTLADMDLAVRENYRSPEHVKRYTVWGMGTDQSRLSAVNGVSVLAKLQGLPPGALGTTKFRPPFAPVALNTIAATHGKGKLLRPWQRLPGHGWHERHGAVFEDLGYLRPSHYPRGSEMMEEAAQREALAVRAGVGLLEASPFGKFEFKGPDAAAFLDRISSFRLSKLAVGRVGYHLMLGELGTILDDGVVARLADDHFLLVASSAHAVRVARWLEDWLQCEWPSDVVMRDVTTAWAVLTLAGPKAREVLKAADCSLDLDTFAHHSVAAATIAGLDVRIQRVSFTGEPSYEINVPAAYAEAMADHLFRAGEPFGIVPFGLEAQEILRLEKGYLHVGTDTDGETQPADIGWKSPGRREGDFLGRSALHHSRASVPMRQQSVGLEALDPNCVLPVGAHIIGGHPHPSQGFVTSSMFSPTLERSLALALLKGGQTRHGEIVRVWSEGREWKARVTSPRFFDPKGERLHG